MKILLSGEGRTDYGEKEYGTNEWKDGPVQVLISKIFTSDSIEFICVEKQDLLNRKTKLGKKTLGELKGHGIVAYLLGFWARENKIDYDIISLYRDCDKDSGVKSSDVRACQIRYERIKSDIINGFSKICNRNNYVAIVPVRMIENWLLSDIGSFEKAFDNSEPYKLPKNPEQIWGDKDDKSSNYPKYCLHRVIYGYNSKPCREIYCTIAEHIDLDVIKQKCPSFDDFYNTIREKSS